MHGACGQFRSTIIASAIAAVACFAAAACSEAPAEGDDPIVGGIPEPGYYSVPMMTFPAGNSCSGTMIGERTVLTAAHCVYRTLEVGGTGGEAYFGQTQESAEETVGIAQLAVHPAYHPDDPFNYDVALVRLAYAPTGAPPMPMHTAPVPNSWLGSDVKAVGFGYSDPDVLVGGVKHSVELTIDGITPIHIGYGNEFANTCFGDSGGPLFMEIDGVEMILGTTSFGRGRCTGMSHAVRTDVYLDWVHEILDAWEGECAFDGECRTDCPRSPDPDCDPCGFNGQCVACLKTDSDCAPLTRPGWICDSAANCLSGLCAPALDTDAENYCTNFCATDSDCADPIPSCVAGTCRYDGASPGAAGWQCSSDHDCGSGLCDGDSSECVAACSDEAAVCEGGKQCAPLRPGIRACLPSAERSGCNAGGSSGFGGVLALLTLAAIGGRRRSRPNLT